MKKFILALICFLCLGEIVTTGIWAVGKPYEFNKRTRFIGDIPVIEVYRKDMTRMPLVILSHGFSRDKRMFFDKTDFAMRLVEKGFMVVAMDNRGHGERRGPKFNQVVLRGLNFDMYQVRKLIKESADDVSVIIDAYETNPLVDRERIGLAGVSMGGFITFRALMADNRIEVGASLIGSPCWEDIPREVPFPLHIDRSKSAIAKLKAYSMKYSPNYFPETFQNKVLLIQNGMQDKHVDSMKVKAFYDRLKSEYPANDGLQMITYSGLKHEVNGEMIDNTVRWFCEKLTSDKAMKR